MDGETTRIPGEIGDDARRRKQKMRAELSKRWLWSPWRLVPLPIFAYIVTAGFFELIDTPDALLRAIGPVLTVMSFIIMGPVIRNVWHREMRKRIQREWEKSISQN